MKPVILITLVSVLIGWNEAQFSFHPDSSSLASLLPDTPRVNIPHKTFDVPCEACHTTESWKILKPDIDYDHARTGFPLIGAHLQIACSACHAGGKFSATVRECYMCHADPHQAELGVDCERCHNETAWAPSIFTHDDQTFFMTGAHKGLDCASCHKNLITFKMPAIRECGDCHVPLGATTDHTRYKIFGDCLACHNLNAWDNYPHLDEWFSLTGHHRRSCETCHRQAPNYSTYTCRECHDFDHKGEGHDD